MRRRAFLALPATVYAASTDLYKRLLGAIERIEVIDTHEHILPEADRLRLPVDFFTLASHYLIDDLSSAGLAAEDRARMEKPEVAAKDKFRAFGEYWRYARFTGYGEALRIAIRDIYGIDEISERTIDRINNAIRERNKPGLYREVLKKRARIRYAVNDEYWQPRPTPVDPEFFLLARKFEAFLEPITPAGVERLEKLADVDMPNLAGLKRGLDKHFLAGLKLGMVTVKSTIAYERDLHFPITSEADASADFDKLRRGQGVVTDERERLDRRPFRALSNYMFHYLVQLAEAHGVPFQVHTGMQAGNGNYVQHSEPLLLTNVFLRYPRVQFDVFHIGFPYTSEATAIGKMFPNVCVDYCWMHIISPSAARAALHEMLDSVPANKIFGFGGDYRYPELSYAHLVMARRNIAKVLAERVEDGAWTETEALDVARWLLHDNPARLFVKRNA
jgi:hypothetical protein